MRQLEATITGISHRAIWLQDLKQARSFHGEIKGVFGSNHVALALHFFRGHDARTRTQHKAVRRISVGSSLATGLPDILVQQIFKDGTVSFETIGIDVS